MCGQGRRPKWILNWKLGNLKLESDKEKIFDVGSDLDSDLECEVRIRAGKK